MKDLAFYRWLAIINGGVPLLVLGWDAAHGQLGANAVNAALHITGILSLVFLLLSLSITPLSRMTGWGGWIGFRRALGLYGFFYAVLHLAIYVGFDRALDLGSTFHEIATRRFLLIGMIAVLLMVPLAVTSTNGMIQRMGPKRWKQLHRLAYVVAGLGVLHFFLLVKSDIRQPVAFGVVLAGLLGTRFGWPRASGKAAAKTTRSVLATKKPASKKPWSGELELVARVRETPEVVTFRLMAPDRGPLPFTYQPGQYLTLQVEIDGRTVRRSYTIASTPTRPDGCELTVKREPEGLVSRHLHDRLMMGDRLRIMAPLGRFTFTGEGESDVLLVAGGVGITPVMSMLRALTDRNWNGRIWFLVVAKSEQDLIFRSEIELLAQRHPGLNLLVTLTRADEKWAGARGRPTAEMVTGFLPHVARVPAFVCGPEAMMEATVELLVSLGAARERIQTEAFVSPGVAALSNGSDAAAVGAFAVMDGVADVNGDVDAIESAVGETVAVTFSKSGVEAEAAEDESILEAAETAGVDLPWECRSGICGQCKVRLLSGRVVMEAEDALSPAEKRAGMILACQAHAKTAVVVEA